MKIFSGSSNKLLANRLAKSLDAKIGKLELSRFGDGERRVWVKEKTISNEAVLLQSLSYPPDENLVEFCLIADSLKRMGVKKLIGVIPYLGYSKQDKIFREGEPLSVKVISRLLQTVNFSRLFIFDLHNQSIVGFFDNPVVQLSAFPLFLNEMKKLKDKSSIVIAPDAGSIKTSAEFAHKLNLDIAYINKKRDLSSGKVIIKGISKKVAGKKAIIIDDMIATGSTLIETSIFLKKKGVEKIWVAATHHLYINGVQEKLDKSAIDKLYVSDTVQPPKSRKSKKLKIISIADTLAKSIKKYQ